MGGARKLNFALIGTGGVGRALLESILASRDHHAATYGVWFNACLVADSSGAIALPSIADAKLRLALETKAAGGKLRELADRVDGVRARGADESASDFLKALVGELEPESIVIDCAPLRRGPGEGRGVGAWAPAWSRPAQPASLPERGAARPPRACP